MAKQEGQKIGTPGVELADSEPTKVNQADRTREGVKGLIEDSGADEGVRGPSLKDKMSSELKGIAEVGTPEWLPEKLGEYKILSIDITDSKALETREGKMKLVPFVGKLTYDTFRDRGEEGSDWNPDDPELVGRMLDHYFWDFVGASKIYVISENDRVIGFYCLKYRDSAKGRRSAHVLLATLDRPCRGTKANEFLSRTVFENEKVDAFTGFTHTPQVVKSWIRLGTMTDMDVYFCGRKNGDAREPLREKEQKDIDEFMESDLKKQADEYSCEEIPGHPHYTNYGEVAIPPRKLEEVRLSPDDPVYLTLKELIEFQQAKFPKETLYGSMMMIRKK